MLKREFYNPKKDVFDAVIKAMENIDAKIVQSDFENGIIEGKIGMSLLSWGNTVKVNIISSTKEKTFLNVESKSNMIQIGYGVNQEYENKIISNVAKFLFSN